MNEPVERDGIAPIPPKSHHIKIHQKLEFFLSANKIPNIIFHGPSGTGKKTIVYNFLNKIYGGDKHTLKSNIMSVNCCHGKGIKFIREELKFFSKMNIQHNSGVSFKSIVLFNADCLTIDAQSALRRCIELFSHNTRFFIVVENIHKLLNPIISRFCEIYVPELLAMNADTAPSFVNLHKREIEETADELDEINGRTKRAKIKEHMDGLNVPAVQLFPKRLIETVGDFYENGISAVDILAYMPVSPDVELFFHKTKSNFRCEKLIMFYVLWKIFDVSPVSPVRPFIPPNASLFPK
jgi:hypothetical protein